MRYLKYLSFFRILFIIGLKYVYSRRKLSLIIVIFFFNLLSSILFLFLEGLGVFFKFIINLILLFIFINNINCFQV